MVVGEISVFLTHTHIIISTQTKINHPTLSVIIVIFLNLILLREY